MKWGNIFIRREILLIIYKNTHIHKLLTDICIMHANGILRFFRHAWRKGFSVIIASDISNFFFYLFVMHPNLFKNSFSLHHHLKRILLKNKTRKNFANGDISNKKGQVPIITCKRSNFKRAEKFVLVENTNHLKWKLFQLLIMLWLLYTYLVQH